MSTVFDEQPDLGDHDLPSMDLEDRHALRRVAGLSTELQDISEVEYRALRLERVVLIGVWAEGSLASAENSLRELSRLAETAGSEVLDGLIQRRSRIDAATYVGSGKARELAGIVAAAGADTVICDGELTPSQLRNLEGVVRVKVTRQQVGLGLRDREDNVRGAFRVPPQHDITVRGRRVLVVDDVYTTGSTVSAHGAGAQERRRG